jgi:NAD(P)-dependent dehydrogenase (short-subunit alcohol dehydrogenase family)
MFGESLAKEEPEVTAVSIRPGVVDTEMQAVIRREGKESRNALPDTS